MKTERFIHPLEVREVIRLCDRLGFGRVMQIAADEWLGRAPQWYSEGDKGDFCTKCGCTAVRVREGRPFGKKSKDWEWLLKECLELFECFADDPFMLKEMEGGVVRTHVPDVGEQGRKR